MPGAVGSTLTAFGNLYEQVQGISASVSVDITAYLDASVTDYLNASVTDYIDASVTVQTEAYLGASVTGIVGTYLDASVTGYLDASMTAYLDASVTGYLDASHTAYLDASVTGYLNESVSGLVTNYLDGNVEGQLIAIINEVNASVSTMSTSLSDISTSLTFLGGGPQTYFFHTTAQDFFDSFSSLTGTAVDPAYIHMYNDASYTVVTPGQNPSVDSYSIAFLSFESSFSVAVTGGETNYTYFIQQNEPASLVWDTSYGAFRLLPGLYPNGSLGPHSEPPL
jgi:hypothetical protein